MAITEESRHRLYQALEDKIGREHATTLMEQLPPVGWADVATKRDLDALETRLKAEWRAELHREIRNLTIQLLGGFAILNGLLVAALRI